MVTPYIRPCSVTGLAVGQRLLADCGGSIQEYGNTGILEYGNKETKMPTPDLKPAISVCCHCPNLYFDFIEVRDFQDEMPADYQGYWVCGLLKNGTALFFDEPQEVKAHDDIIRLEVEAMPENCPYFLE
jgi:hypothetical protein